MRKQLTVLLLGLALLFTGCESPVQDYNAQAEIGATRATYPEWQRDVIYDKEHVTWKGKVYYAKWWTTNEEPGTTGAWGVWEEVSTQVEVLALNLTASASAVEPGTAVTLNWSTDYATEVTATGDWTGVKTLTGSEVVTVNADSTYTLTAKNAKGETVTKSVTVTVNAVVPSLSFSASSATVEKGAAVTLSWNASNVATVTASGAWSGAKALAGSEVVTVNADSDYTLTATDASGASIVKTVSVKVQTVVTGEYPKTVGQTVVLSDSMIQSRYNGIDAAYLPTAVAGSIQELMTRADYETLFPRRYGTALWSQTSGKTAEDYFSYDNLIAALQDLAHFKLRLELKGWSSRTYRLEKATKKATLLREDSDFATSTREAKVFIVDFGKFASEGTLEQRKRDLAAFLGNIAHETTGGWDTAPDGRWAWGLYFKEEVGHDNNSVGGYTDRSNHVYPYNAAESYHGRGPMQLSWNYNYGYFSQIIYGDKMVLINDPDRVANDGKIGFMAGIWFWMTAQGPKPACHDVMVGNWVPTAEDIAANRLPGFGVTINVINGGLEAGIPNDYRVKDRIGFYDMITQRFGITMGENVDCYNQRPF